MTTNVLIVGVGGQGILLAGKLLAAAAMRAGHAVKLSEVHGMAQRGGSVVTHVRYGPQVHSPLVEPGEADAIVAFERLEALRWQHYLKAGGSLVINAVTIPPLTVLIGQASYPADIRAQVEAASTAVWVPAARLATQAGNGRAQNVLLMGVLARRLDLLTLESWLETVADCVPPQTRAVNAAAFSLGFHLD